MSGKDKREQDKREFRTEFSILLTSLREKRYKQRTWGKDWTQQGVANRLGVSRGMYNQWENGRAVPTRSDLKNIVSDFGLDEKEGFALYRTAVQSPPEIDNLPFKPTPFFTGRERQLEQLDQLLKENGSVAPAQPVIISGLAGVGKTELALKYAHDHFPDMYRTVLWVNADNETLQASYASLAQTLKLPEWNERDQDHLVQAVKDWLKEHTNWLLIMDNSDDLPLAESFLPAKPLGHVVYTTRSQIISTVTRHDRQIELEAMTPEEGLLFLLRRSDKIYGDAVPDTDAADTKAARQVVELLGGHPLALDQAGAYIKETSQSFTDYIYLFNKQRRSLLDRRELLVSKYSRHPKSVVVTFRLCFNRVREQHPLAADVLYFCSFCSPDQIDEFVVFYDFSNNSCDSDDRFERDEKLFNEAIAVLRRYSLIRRGITQDNGSKFKFLSIHRLVQAVLIETPSPELQTQWQERVKRANFSIYTSFGGALAAHYYHNDY